MSDSTEKIGFDQLPQAVATILEEVRELKTMLTSQGAKEDPEDEKIWFNLSEVCDYIPCKPTKKTVYAWVAYRQIPYYKTGKKLAFLKSEIDEWISKGSRETATDIRETAIACLGNKKGGRL